MSKKKSLKEIPQLESDEAAERFVGEADLSEYNLSAFKPTHFEFEKKDRIVNLRVSKTLLAAVKATAAARGIHYQRLIRQGMEKVVEGSVVTPKSAIEEVPARILAALQAAGDKGIAVKELSSKLGVEQKEISVWFSSTGKKIGVVKKVGEGRLKYVHK